MAVRVRIRVATSAGRSVEITAILNSSFEESNPHLLLPNACAALLFDDLASISARQEYETAGGPAEFVPVPETVNGRVITPTREGRDVRFRVLVSSREDEALVSDAGIDALGVHLESLFPGRWRFADETLVHDTEAPQRWSNP